MWRDPSATLISCYSTHFQFSIFNFKNNGKNNNKIAKNKKKMQIEKK